MYYLLFEWYIEDFLIFQCNSILLLPNQNRSFLAMEFLSNVGRCRSLSIFLSINRSLGNWVKGLNVKSGKITKFVEKQTNNQKTKKQFLMYHLILMILKHLHYICFNEFIVTKIFFNYRLIVKGSLVLI